MTPRIRPRNALLVGYGRVSTEKQAEEGVSVDAQKADFEGYARTTGGELVAVESDALSGKDTDRPGLRRALALLEAGKADTLLVAKLDRLTRSVRDIDGLLEEYFTDGRFRLVSLGDPIEVRTAIGRFIVRLTVLLGQLEREQIVERTTKSLTHARATGGGTPQVPAAAAARIAELAAGGASLRAICTHLTNEGIPTTKGGLWAPETVRKVLKRAR